MIERPAPIDRSVPLRGCPVACIDFEATTHAGPDAHVVDVAVVHVELGSEEPPRIAFRSLVRPPVSIPADATRVHGIDDAAVAAAPSWAEVAPLVEVALAGRLPAAYCAPADYTFLATEQERLGRAPVAWPWLDLLVVRKATKTRGRPGRLVELAQEHGIVLDAHGATGDALSLAYLVRPLMRAAWSAGAFRGPAGAQPRRWNGGDEEDEDDAPTMKTVGDLLAWQRSAALWQERDFADYCLRRGDRIAPRCDWHRIEGVPDPTWGQATPTTRCSCGALITRRIGQDGQQRVLGADGEVHSC